MKTLKNKNIKDIESKDYNKDYNKDYSKDYSKDLVYDYTFLDFFPLSLNKYYTSSFGGGRRGRFISDIGKTYQQIVRTKLLDIDNSLDRDKPIFDYYDINILSKLDKKRFNKFDIDNMLKPLIDSIFYYIEDNDNKIRRLTVEKQLSEYNSLHITIKKYLLN